MILQNLPNEISNAIGEADTSDDMRLSLYLLSFIVVGAVAALIIVVKAWRKRDKQDRDDRLKHDKAQAEVEAVINSEKKEFAIGIRSDVRDIKTSLIHIDNKFDGLNEVVGKHGERITRIETKLEDK